MLLKYCFPLVLLGFVGVAASEARADFISFGVCAAVCQVQHDADIKTAIKESDLGKIAAGLVLADAAREACITRCIPQLRSTDASRTDSNPIDLILDTSGSMVCNNADSGMPDQCQSLSRPKEKLQSYIDLILDLSESMKTHP